MNGQQTGSIKKKDRQETGESLMMREGRDKGRDDYPMVLTESDGCVQIDIR